MFVLIIVTILLCLIIATSFEFNVNKTDTVVFSKEYSKILKALLTIIIIIHHLSRSAQFEDLVLGRIYTQVGFLCVVGFFTVSGWGTSATLKNNAGGGTYWKKKFSQIVVP